jgi:hypothetical protein
VSRLLSRVVRQVGEMSRLKTEIIVANMLDLHIDVLISKSNQWLRMTGSVTLGIMVRPQAPGHS